jgi:hypothetical protein
MRNLALTGIPFLMIAHGIFTVVRNHVSSRVL